MMNLEQAIAYGKQTGCKFYVKNSNGGLLGGYTSRAAALESLKRWEAEYKNDPWNKGMKVYIVEVN